MRNRGRRFARGVLASTLLAALAAPAVAARPARSAPAAAPPPLEVVLERLARVADFYYDEALSFTCDESILYSLGRTSAHHRYRYLYRHADGKLAEYRELIGKSGRGAARKRAADPISELPGVLLRPYSWVFLFARENRQSFRYALAGEGRVLDTDVIHVRFDALPPYVRGVNEFSGTAYVDRRTFQLVRVEGRHVMQSDPQGLLYTTDFDVLEHGIRFPGRVRIEGWGSFAVTQTYKRYQFFGVRTSAEIWGLGPAN